MSSYYDCTECHGKKTMKAENTIEFHKCKACGATRPFHYILGYWKGWNDSHAKIINIQDNIMKFCKEIQDTMYDKN